jgi:ABC1 atypical kinase-like domain
VVLAAGSSPVSGLVFTVAVLATSMVLVAALAWASRRPLGLSVGVLRAFIASLLGFATAVLLGRVLRAAQPGHEVAFLSVALGVPLIVAMIFAEVAVKVQRPGIRSTVEQDLDIVLRIAAKLESRARWAGSYGLVALAQGFSAAMREELDFRIEAGNMAAMAASWPAQQRAVGGSVAVALPALYDQLSSERVLVIEWLDGVSLRKAGSLIDDRGLDRAELTRALMRSMVYQLTEGGVFHADPHPGNIMLLADERLALLDFGSGRRLDAQLRSGLQNLLLAIGRGGPEAFRDALLDLVTYPDELDEQQLERALGQFMAVHLGAAPGRRPRCSPICPGWVPASS